MYADTAIEEALTIRMVFHLPLRQTEGSLRSLPRMLEVELPIPDHTTLSRRLQKLGVPVLLEQLKDPTPSPRHLPDRVGRPTDVELVAIPDCLGCRVGVQIEVLASRRERTRRVASKPAASRGSEVISR